MKLFIALLGICCLATGCQPSGDDTEANAVIPYSVQLPAEIAFQPMQGDVKLEATINNNNGFDIESYPDPSEPLSLHFASDQLVTFYRDRVVLDDVEYSTTGATRVRLVNNDNLVEVLIE